MTVVVLVLAGAAPASAQGGSGAPTSLGWDPQLTAVGVDTVVTGVVTADGSPLVGADVALVAWPDQDALEGLPDDQIVDTRYVAHVTTGANGQFAVALAPASLGPEYTADDGQVDLDLVVADAEQQIIWSFSATRTEPGLAGATERLWSNPRLDDDSLATRVPEGKGPTHLAIDLGGLPSVVESDNEPATWVGDDGEPLGVLAASDASRVPALPRSPDLDLLGPGGAPQQVVTCVWAASSSYQRNRPERFINSIGTIQGKPTVNQEVGTSHTLGVGMKLTGSGAVWKPSGSLTKSFGASASNFLSYTGAVRNRVNYRLYTHFCNATKMADEWRPHGYHSLNVDHIVISRPAWNKAGHCSSVTKNGTFTKVQGTNATFATGMDLSVINLSVQAKFSKNTKITWSFSSTGARMCGSTTNGPVSSPQAGAYIP